MSDPESHAGLAPAHRSRGAAWHRAAPGRRGGPGEGRTSLGLPRVLAGRALREQSGPSWISSIRRRVHRRGLYDEEAIIAIRVVTRRADEAVGPALVTARVREAVALRKRFVPADVEAYRMLNAESDGLPGVTVDRYGDYLVAHVFTPALLGLTDAIYDALMPRPAPRRSTSSGASSRSAATRPAAPSWCAERRRPSSSRCARARSSSGST